jgi:hypothetical protein
MSVARRGIHFNDDWQSWHAPFDPSLEDVHHFHTSLPDYSPTPLVKLDHLATEIGVRAIYLKDESARLGLPSFKILGASWGSFRAIVSRLKLPLDSTLNAVKQALEGCVSNISLHAATDGNHGRGVARVGRWLGYVSLPGCRKPLSNSSNPRAPVSSGRLAAMMMPYLKHKRHQLSETVFWFRTLHSAITRRFRKYVFGCVIGAVYWDLS